MTTFHPFLVHAADSNIFGEVKNPTNIISTNGSGLFIFLGYILELVGTIAGIYMVFQLISAGYTYISANGDVKKTEQAWAMIWQSLIGIVIIASAFVIASVVSRITNIQILTPIIYGPSISN
jgi:hypothetical protein